MLFLKVLPLFCCRLQIFPRLQRSLWPLAPPQSLSAKSSHTNRLISNLSFPLVNHFDFFQKKKKRIIDVPVNLDTVRRLQIWFEKQTQIQLQKKQDAESKFRRIIPKRSPPDEFFLKNFAFSIFGGGVTADWIEVTDTSMFFFFFFEKSQNNLPREKTYFKSICLYERA